MEAMFPERKHETTNDSLNIGGVPESVISITPSDSHMVNHEYPHIRYSVL